MSAENLMVENCAEINARELTELRASFDGLLQDAPTEPTSTVNGLSQQLVYQLQLQLPDVFVSFDQLNVDLTSSVFPYLQRSAQQALQQAIQDRGQTMLVNSAYRTIAQQMLLYNGRFNNSNPVAPPGASNHQTGLAIDIEDPRGWEPYLTRYGWSPLPGDPPHFDFLEGGTIDIRSQSILAFQKLWNQNNVSSQIAEDGAFGPQTENALNRSPAKGFAKAPWDDKPRLLRLAMPRMEGSDVMRLQTALVQAGMTLTVDSEFGPATDKAVKQFQSKQNLTVDGVVGSKTREQMA